MEISLAMPAMYDVLWSLVVLVALPLVVVALLRWRTAELQYPVVWLLVILLLPALGAAAFLVRAPGRSSTVGVSDADGR